MAINYFNRYIWLIEVINRHGYISRKDISDLWARSQLNEFGESYLPERTFHNHISSIFETFGIEIKCDRSLGYYIANSDDIKGDEIRKWLMQSLSLNNLLNESHNMRDSIIFEEVPSSEKYLSAIIEAIHDKKRLKSHQDSPRSIPPLLKQNHTVCDNQATLVYGGQDCRKRQAEDHGLDHIRNSAVPAAPIRFQRNSRRKAISRTFTAPALRTAIMQKRSKSGSINHRSITSTPSSYTNRRLLSRRPRIIPYSDIT